MSTYREEILRATAEAHEVLQKFPVENNRTSFDIIGAVTESEIPLVFRPLEGLWGTTVTLGEDLRGIMVTTKLRLPVQRFTLAHELGHIMLGHQLSLDKEIAFDGRFGASSVPIEELAANTFASELLASKSLMAFSARRHHWDKKALNEPSNIYQLSLRLGISYQATCWALASNKVISSQTAKSLQNIVVKNLKSQLISTQHLENRWADVWRLTENDSGTFLEAGPDDVFLLQLQENASAGYLWELIDAGSHSKIIEDQTQAVGDLFGSYTSKTILMRFSEPGVHRLIFEHHRPWNDEKIGYIDVSVSNLGKEEEGLSRRTKDAMLMRKAA